MKTAVIYMRITPPIQDCAVQQQERICRDFAEKNGYEVVGAYSDQVPSSKPQIGLTRLLEDAKQGKFEFVIVHSADRISRRMNDYYSYARQLYEYGIGIVSAKEQMMNAAIYARFATTEQAKPSKGDSCK